MVIMTVIIIIFNYQLYILINRIIHIVIIINATIIITIIIHGENDFAKVSKNLTRYRPNKNNFVRHQNF